MKRSFLEERTAPALTILPVERLAMGNGTDVDIHNPDDFVSVRRSDLEALTRFAHATARYAERFGVAVRPLDAALSKLRTQIAESDPVLAIVNFVSEKLKVSMPAFHGKGRTAEVVWARWVAWHLSHKLLGRSGNSIARALGRDHGTLLYGLKALKSECELYPAKQKEVDRIEVQLRAAIGL